MRREANSATCIHLRRSPPALAQELGHNTTRSRQATGRALQDLFELGTSDARPGSLAAETAVTLDAVYRLAGMKALSVRQPWAWLIVNGYKPVENRNWLTKFRGRLLIHAGQRFDPKGVEAARLMG